MLALWRYGRNVLLVVLCIVAVVSFAATQFGGNLQNGVAIGDWQWHSQPTWASFYLATGRVWELMIGALAAIYLRMTSEVTEVESWSRQAAAAVGMVLIGYSVVAFDSRIPFPSAYTLVPVVGAVLIILFGTSASLVGKLLALPILVGIGTISYSAYLWHQPLFAFARIRMLSAPGLGVYCLLILVSVALAYVSWRFVEQPFRNRRNFSSRHVFSFSAAATAILIAVGVFGHMAGGFEGRLSERALAMLSYRNDRADLRLSCDAGAGTYIEPADRCSVGADATPTMAIFGDSHARELAYFLGEEVALSNRSAKVLVHASCPPILGISPQNAPGSRCAQNNEDIFEYLRTADEITHVILAARWTLYIEADRFDNGEGGKEYGDPFPIAPIGGQRFAFEASSRELQIGALVVRSVQQLLELGKHVILVYPVPEVGWNVPEYLAKSEMFGLATGGDLSTGYGTYLERNSRTIEMLDSIGEHDGLRRVRPASVWCNTHVRDRCLAQLHGTPLYFDDNHPSSAGAAPIVASILREIAADGERP